MMFDRVMEFIDGAGPLQGMAQLAMGMPLFFCFRDTLPKGMAADICHNMYAQWFLCVVLLNFIPHAPGALDGPVWAFKAVTGTVFMGIIFWYGVQPIALPKGHLQGILVP